MICLLAVVFCVFSICEGWEKGSDWEAWTDAQIQQDFAPYEDSGITLEMLDQTMEWNCRWRHIAYHAWKEGMVRYRVVDSVIYQTHHEVVADQIGLAGLNVLEEMIKRYPVPDVDFIYFDQDGPLAPFLAPDQSAPFGPILASTKRDNYQNIILYHDWATPSNIKGVLQQGDWSWASYSWEYVIKEVEEGVKDYPWDTKTPKVFWRGRASERTYTIADYRQSPRVAMAYLSQQFPELLDVAITSTCNNSFLLNLSDFPPLKPHVSTQEHLRYKYQITIDGAAATYPGFAWRLLSNCLVFKVNSPVRQWFDAGLTPGFHYIPIETDLSDLLDKIKWAQENDGAARAIAENGRIFAQNSIMPDDVVLYCYKVLLKYASLQRFKPEVPDLSPKQPIKVEKVKKDKRKATKPTPCQQFELVSSPLSEAERAERREVLRRLFH